MRVFRIVFCALAMVFLVCRTPGSAQDVKSERMFTVPGDVISVVIVHQPASPLEFVDALVLRSAEDNGSTCIYRVRNRGGKAIKSFAVAAVMSSGTVSRWSVDGTHSSLPLLPGQTEPRILEDWGFQIALPRDTEKTSARSVSGLVVFIVVRAEYVDGSAYEATNQYEALHRLLAGPKT